MNARTKRINAAIALAKARDGGCCRVCGKSSRTGNQVVGAHILPRNVAFPWYHADSEKWIITMCDSHHDSYDHSHSAWAKVRWLYDHGLNNEAAQLEMGLEGALNE